MVSKRMREANRKRLLGKRSNNWKGGRTISNGWVFVYKPKHPYSKKSGYIAEHRVIMEKHIGRYLRPKEVIHHINGIKTDNRIKNLLLTTWGKHVSMHKRKPVSMLDNNGKILRVFNSRIEAARALGYKSGNVMYNNKKYGSFGGYKWDEVKSMVSTKPVHSVNKPS